MTIDKVELRIIQELMQDGQIPFSKIAKKLDISPETVRKKYAKMRKEGVITHCSITIDIAKIGYVGQAFLFIKILPSKEKSVLIDQLKNIKYVTVIGKLIGDFDISVIAVIKDLKTFTELLSEIKMLPGVERIETSITIKPVSRKTSSENKFTQNTATPI